MNHFIIDDQSNIFEITTEKLTFLNARGALVKVEVGLYKLATDHLFTREEVVCLLTCSDTSNNEDEDL